MALLSRKFGQTAAGDKFSEYVVFLTGLTGLLAMVPMIYLYRGDSAGRRAGGILSPASHIRMTLLEKILLLATGAGMAQLGNMVMAVLQMFMKDSAYAENMAEITEGKGILMLVFWIGIIAPIAEETVFRWTVYLRLRDYMKTGGAVLISAVLFGIYHGNAVQFIYATALGAMFALFLERSGNPGSCVLLHIGANVWSLLLSEYGVTVLDRLGAGGLLLTYALILSVMAAGIIYFMTGGRNDKRKI